MKPSIGFVNKGIVKFTHDYEGMKLEGTLDDGSEFYFLRPCREQASCHVEFFFKDSKKKVGSALEVSSIHQTYFIWLLNHKEALTKIHLATEELYNLANQETK